MKFRDLSKIRELEIMMSKITRMSLKPWFVYAVVVVQSLSAINAVALDEVIYEYFPEERAALLQIRDLLNSTSNLHANWTGPPCLNNKSRWAGVACFNGHITHFVLQGIELTGSLPPAFLQNLTFLTKLSFTNNSLYGPLPILTNLLNLQFVYLSQNRFSGSIPYGYVALPRLTVLELQHNSLTGSIPPFDQPTLTLFNVSYNQLEGPIPKTAVLQRFPKSSFANNSNLCGIQLGIPCPPAPVPVPAPAPAPTPAPVPTPAPSPLPSKHNKNKIFALWLIILIVAIVPLSLLVLLFLFLYWKICGKKVKDKSAGEEFGDVTERKIPWPGRREDPERTIELDFFDKDTPMFNLEELLGAPAEVMGKGQIGTTYKVILDPGTVVAVKRLKGMNEVSKKEFLQQMQLLGRTKHPNLVKILSFYHSMDEKMIITEFVPHASLFHLLHESRGVGRVPLNWSSRLSIVKDIAKGLIFLHQALPHHKAPHANLKSSNVLVHQNHHALLTDFGFLPLLPAPKSAQRLAVARTPEFSQGKRLTHAADVYCFGIVVLEVITGMVPGDVSVSSQHEEEGFDATADWIRKVVSNSMSTDILDLELLASSQGIDKMMKLAQLAIKCTDEAPESRPSMVQVLEIIVELEQAN